MPSPDSSFTPGPWVADGFDVRQPGGRMIAYTGPHHTPANEYPAGCRMQDERNAKAIAALPDLIEVASAMMLWLEAEARQGYPAGSMSSHAVPAMVAKARAALSNTRA